MGCFEKTQTVSWPRKPTVFYATKEQLESRAQLAPTTRVDASRAQLAPTNGGLRLGLRLGSNQKVFRLRRLRTEGFLKVVPESGYNDRF